MNSADRGVVLHCLKSMIDEEVCEECPIYGMTGTDHCEKDCVRFAINALEQEPREDVSDINDGNIYECPCGYGWDKSKVVRHHFCPNCGRAVDSTEQEPCDAVSRKEVMNMLHNHAFDYATSTKILALIKTMCGEVDRMPSVTPQYTEAEIQKMQELEQAEIQKAYEIGKAENIEMLDEIKSEIVHLHDWAFSREEILRIIDKYKAEGSDKE